MVPSKVHLVGSVALDSVEEVFRTGTVLGHRLRRVPDGEPGGRRLWISWQYPLLRSLPFLNADASQPNQTSGFLPLHLAERVAPGAIRFPELGYAREARILSGLLSGAPARPSAARRPVPYPSPHHSQSSTLSSPPKMRWLWSALTRTRCSGKWRP
jgi:hypothetical protein